MSAAFVVRDGCWRREKGKVGSISSLFEITVIVAAYIFLRYLPGTERLCAPESASTGRTRFEYINFQRSIIINTLGHLSFLPPPSQKI